jgi:fructose PTS system EIIBC or EIIC component
MSNNEAVKDFFGDISVHLKTGISYMIPVIIIYALFMILSQIPGPTQELFATLSDISKVFMIPIMTVFIAFSIGGKPAFAPAIILGMMADQLGMGFIGGLIVGLITGYAVKSLIILSGKLGGGQVVDILTSLLIIPVVIPIVIGALVYFVIANPVVAMMTGLTAWLNSLSDTNAVVLAAILGAMIGVDMGGPINKIAYTFAVGAYVEGAYAVSAPVMVAISIPTITLAIAPFLAPNKYTFEEKLAQKSAIVMGAIGLTEGAIPFAVTDPLRVIPMSILGCSLGAALAAAFGINNTVLIPSLLGLSGVNNIPLYLLAHVIAVAVCVVLINLVKKVVPEEDR